MMSPLSLAQYVNPENMKFDVVVFDEASQITPEDSLGSIVRGKQLVVAGDEQQLPPTSFFQKEVMTYEDEEDEDEELSTPDLGSILEECNTIGIKAFTLKWHYRSRHESLIHFSNKNFYKNELITFPSPECDSKKMGLFFNYIPDSIYDRGGNAVNRKEAQQIAKAVMTHYITNSNKTLGVGAFSQRQQYAIIDEIEYLRKEDPSLEHFFSKDLDEPFFVKNLETIQGDERDYIYISIGYGKDSQGRLSMNFGPINKSGGSRRLNVLITRAREKVVVFSSIKSDDFDLSKTNSEGVEVFKNYLEYAEAHGDIEILHKKYDSFGDYDENNLFEKSVYEQLKEEGIKAIPQVGYAGYKIDFGILDPDNPSKFILAVECDGASYHSSLTARDRDRLRQEVLENLNWKFHRIWSTDWFLNPHREMERLKEAIEKAKNNFSDVSNECEVPEVILIDNLDKKTEKNFGYEIIPYKKYQIKNTSSPEKFYEADKMSSLSIIIKLINEIVDVEAPIHIKELALRVIQNFRMGRVGNKIVTIIMKYVELLTKTKEIVYKNEFIFRKNFKFNKIRTRGGEDSITNIEYISSEEIQNAIILVVKKEFAIAEYELIVKVARLFEFQHTGQKIQEYIKKEITKLRRKKIIINSENGLRIE